MYDIHHMKRTQIYLDAEMAKTLSALSRQKGMTVSELIRESIQEKYISGKSLNKGSLARQIGGIWKKRKDMGNLDLEARALRKGRRIERLGLGRNTA
jgi:predicted DNA-binding protein